MTGKLLGRGVRPSPNRSARTVRTVSMRPSSTSTRVESESSLLASIVVSSQKPLEVAVQQREVANSVLTSSQSSQRGARIIASIRSFASASTFVPSSNNANHFSTRRDPSQPSHTALLLFTTLTSSIDSNQLFGRVGLLSRSKDGDEEDIVNKRNG